MAPAERLVLPTRKAEQLDKDGVPVCAGRMLEQAERAIDRIPRGWFGRSDYERKQAASAADAYSRLVKLVPEDSFVLPLETARTFKGWRYLRTHFEERRREWLVGRRRLAGKLA